jgi:hypothetical protein
MSEYNKGVTARRRGRIFTAGKGRIIHLTLDLSTGASSGSETTAPQRIIEGNGQMPDFKMLRKERLH